MVDHDSVAALIEENTRTGLVRRCEAAGVSTDGTKEDLARRLVEAEEIGRRANDATDTTGYLDTDAASTVDIPPKMESPLSYLVQPYSFRDVEDGIEEYGSDLAKDIAAWFDDFEGVATMARWTDERSDRGSNG